ncbi:hypothetical protein A0H81_09528 [Grifola frondosa]|uniref:Uncharacterized protein n=1 Tax=Grifola frondosa TaxID=5627 RepID=A0A1C7M6R3_GRIFR|nr:hypothetical protein A0H81_09528 [Grifola frondosa]
MEIRAGYDFTAVVRTSIIQILRTPGGPYHDWFMEGVRDTPRSKQLEEHIFGKISHANAAVWEMYVTFAVAAVFAHYVDIIPNEGGSAEVQAVTATGQVDEESGTQEGGRNH